MRVLPALAMLSWALAPVVAGAAPQAAGREEAPLEFVRRPDEPPSGFEKPELPDLRTLPPSSFEIRDFPQGRVLRFANTIWNSGVAPLELQGAIDRTTRRTFVSQQSYTADGRLHTWPVGEFVWHPTHTHWHLDGFASYQLWPVTGQGELDVLVASSDKVSFCLIDTEVVGLDDPLRPAGRHYVGCGRGTQGLSIGWGDRYASHLDGQSLPLDEVADGLYAFVSTANPAGRLRESDHHNNAARVYLAIAGDEITIVPWRAILQERCLTGGRC
jgi:hypothetical protein